MIYESYPWKDDLLKISKKLSKRLVQKRWSNRSDYCFEKEIFISFYIIRKLIEANKLSSDIINLKIDCITYPSSNKTVTFTNKHRTDELFLFDKMKDHKVEIIQLCNLVIHSYIFNPVLDDNKVLCGFFISSDKTRNRLLYFLELGNIIKVLQKTGNDYPNIMFSKYDENKKDFVFTQFMINNSDDEKRVEKIMHNKQINPTARSSG